MENKLQDFIDGLVRTPIRGHRFTASFNQTSASGGTLFFKCLQNENQAQIDWEAYLFDNEVYALLRYNQTLTILHTKGEDFINAIEKYLPVF